MIVSRHCWVWAALSAGTTAARVLGEADLSSFLAASGVEPADDAPVVVAEAPRGRLPDPLPRLLGELGPDAEVAIAGAGGAPVWPQSRSPAHRVVELGATATRAAPRVARLAAVRRELERAGLETAAELTGDRSRHYAIGRRSLIETRRAPEGWILRGARGELRPSILADGLAGVRDHTGATVDGPILVRTSGKYTVPLASPSGPLLFRAAAGPPRRALDRAQDTLGALSRAPDVIRSRLPRQLADVIAGPLRCVAEEYVAGGPPRTIEPALMDELVEFLVAVHASGEVRPAGEDELRARFEAQAASMAWAVDAEPRVVLDSLPARLAADLAGVPLGRQHGDFWNENLIVAGGRLRCVVDWDWSEPAGLPGLDLLDLLALGGHATREYTQARRLRELLWPLAVGGGGPEIERYCAATGTPSGPVPLHGLVAAHWLDRTARTFDRWDPRRDMPVWAHENVAEPLRFFARAFGGAT